LTGARVTGETIEMALGLLVCVERGYLEPQSVLFCRSARRFGGRYANSPIYCFHPRAGYAPSRSTIEALRECGAAIVDEPLNQGMDHYPIANKVFVCEWAEKNLDEEVLVFADSDSLFVAEPTALDLPGGCDIGVRPVDHKWAGSTGPSDPNDRFWRAMYEKLGVSEQPYTTSTIDQQRIRAYYNAGLVAVRRSSQIFSQWAADFRALAESGLRPRARETAFQWYFLDQLALAATAARSHVRVAELPWTYNYPLNFGLRLDYPGPGRRADLTELVHVHYHRSFETRNFLQHVRPRLSRTSEVFRWLSLHLPLQPEKPEPGWWTRLWLRAREARGEARRWRRW
jgi:hypothetical protein